MAIKTKNVTVISRTNLTDNEVESQYNSGDMIFNVTSTFLNEKNISDFYINMVKELLYTNSCV